MDSIQIWLDVRIVCDKRGPVAEQGRVSCLSSYIMAQERGLAHLTDCAFCETGEVLAIECRRMLASRAPEA